MGFALRSIRACIWQIIRTLIEERTVIYSLKTPEDDLWDHKYGADKGNTAQSNIEYAWKPALERNLQSTEKAHIFRTASLR
jgi:hypothetical protein